MPIVYFMFRLNVCWFLNGTDCRCNHLSLIHVFRVVRSKYHKVERRVKNDEMRFSLKIVVSFHFFSSFCECCLKPCTVAGTSYRNRLLTYVVLLLFLHCTVCSLGTYDCSRYLVALLTVIN